MEAVIQKILSDYWYLGVAVVMLAGHGMGSLFVAYFSRNNPNLQKLADGLKTLADAWVEKAKKDDDLLNKLINEKMKG